jgi:hypothetical protein
MDHWFSSPTGIHKFWKDNDDGSHTVVQSQKTDGMLETNKAMATHNDGYSESREFRRVASIPLILVAKWLQEEGWDAFNPDHAHKLAEKLNSSEYAYLRTDHGQRLGVLQDGGFR